MMENMGHIRKEKREKVMYRFHILRATWIFELTFSQKLDHFCQTFAEFFKSWTRVRCERDLKKVRLGFELDLNWI